MGSVVTLKHDAVNAPLLAVDDAAWDKMMNALTANDRIGLKRLIRRRKVYPLHNDKKARILNAGLMGGSYKVRITKGPNRGVAGWVFRELIKGQ